MTLLERLIARRDEMRGRLNELRGVSDRDLDDNEMNEVDRLLVDLPPLDERIVALQDQQRREDAYVTSQATTAASVEQDGATRRSAATVTVTEPDLYRSGGPHSYFRDLARSQVFGDREATDRLVRSAAVHQERALGNTNTTGGAGGEFAPPQWMIDQFVAMVRAGRVTADLFVRQDVPLGVSSVNLPRILTGTAVAPQSTQNTALANVDMTTGSVGTGFTTIGGRQVVSQQILDQSAVDFDQVVLRDLAGAYAAQVGAQVFLGPGSGANNNSVVNGLNAATILPANNVAYTTATPTAATFYSKAAGALAAFTTNRLVAPNAWVMHPRRWFWLLAQTDGQGRPLVVPIANAALGASAESVNAMADAGAPAASGLVGLLLGLPVYIDPAVPTNLGAGTNQDRVYLLRTDDLFLFESTPRAEVFRETYADSLGVLFRLYAYVGTILNRLPSSIAWVDGTGLVTPTF